MIGWRLFKSTFVSTALSGEGARRYPGRWNFSGWPMVYLAGTQALGMLEILVHADPDLLPTDFVIGGVDLSVLAPTDIERVSVSTLPRGWDDSVATDFTRKLGTLWLREQRSCVLVVPSAIVPSESNYLFNPNHPSASGVRLGAVTPLRFDARLRPPRFV